jgi:hypothetical protein
MVREDRAVRTVTAGRTTPPADFGKESNSYETRTKQPTNVGHIASHLKQSAMSRVQTRPQRLIINYLDATQRPL